MNKRKQLIVAFLVFIVALFGNKWYLETRIAEGTESRFVDVIRVKKGMEEGALLSLSNIEAAHVPEKYAPRAAIPWKDRQQFEQQPLGSKVVSGDYLLETAFATRGTVGLTLSQQLEGEDFRAITLPVDDTNSFARSIVSGDRIDILFTFSLPPIRQRISTILLQNVPVISTGSYSAAAEEIGERGARAGKYNTITLKVNARDAARLNYARQAGTISLLLRSIRDGKNLEMQPISSIEDVLSSTDRSLINELLKNVRGEGGGGGERNEALLREQARASFEQQKKQMQQLQTGK